MDCVTRSKIPLRPHQVKVVEYILNPRNSGLLVVHFCGMGKSLSAIASSQGFLDLNPLHNIVVICGKSLIPNFKKEMLKYGVRNANRYSFFTYSKVMHLHKKNKTDQVPCSKNTMIIIKIVGTSFQMRYVFDDSGWTSFSNNRRILENLP